MSSRFLNITVCLLLSFILSLAYNTSVYASDNVTLASHQSGDPVREVEKFVLDVQNPSVISKINIFISSSQIAILEEAPFEFSIDTYGYQDGVHELLLQTELKSGVVENNSYEVFVNNDEIQDIGSAILSPSEGDTITSIFTLVAQAYDDVAVKEVLFFVDGEYAGYDNVTPYEHIIATDKYSNGEHELMVKALDFGGRTSTSTAIVSFYNEVEPDPTPIIAEPIVPPETPVTPLPGNTSEQVNTQEIFALVTQLIQTLLLTGSAEDLGPEILQAITGLTDVLTLAINQNSSQLKSTSRTKRIPRLMKLTQKALKRGVRTKRVKKRKRSFKRGLRKLNRLKSVL